MSLHGIKIVTLKTGLSSHVIRVWEKRYNAVTPERSDTNRRLYSDASLERLMKLADLTKAGHSIGQIAHLPDKELEKLHKEIPVITSQQETVVDLECAPLIDAALGAIASIDQRALEKTLDEAFKKIGYSGLLERILIPLIVMVGDAWHNGSITTAEEHAASSFIKDYLCVSARSYSHEEHAPTLLVTTPSGQLHELGAVIAASQARKLGWKVVYLGPSLPADEIAGAAEKVNAKAVMLSVIYPIDDPFVDKQLRRLRSQLDSSVSIIVGGSALANYQETLDEIKAIQLHSISGLTDQLAQLRG